MAFLKYEISVVGVDKVRQAMRAVEREAEGAGRRSRLRDPSGRGGSAAANTNASVREAEAVYRLRENAAARAARAEEREHARAERRKTAISEREARTRNRAEMALNRQRSSALYAQFREEERARKHAGLLADAERRRGRAEFARTTRGVLAGTASGVASVGRAAIGATGLAGGAIFAASTHSAMARHATAAELANQLTGRDASAGSLAAKKREILDAAGSTRGFSAVEVMAGMSKFQAQAGEGEATLKMAPIMTETALASGASVEELGDMYSALYAAIRRGSGGAEKSVDQIIKEVEQLGRSFVAMGQIGSIELKDFASQGNAIAATAQRYEGDRATNIRSTAALAQMARVGGATSAEEAATSVSRFADDLVEHSDLVNQYLGEKGAKKIYANEEKTALRPLVELLPDLMEATGGNLEKMGGVFNVRSMRAVQGFTPAYQDAYKKAKEGGASETEARGAGKKAVRKTLDEFNAIEASKEEQKVKADARMAEADKAFEEQMRKLTTAVGEHLLPQFTALIPSVSKLVPAFATAAEMFAKLTKYIADAPVESAFAGLGALFALEIAKAGISKVIAASFASQMGGGGAGAGGKMNGALGAAGLGLALGAAAYTGISVAGRSTFDDAKTGTDQVMHDLSRVHGADLGSAIVEAEQKLKVVQDEAGLFGKFMDLFGAGPGGEIASAQALVDQKKQEYATFRATGRLSPEDAADVQAQRDLAAAGIQFASTGTTFEKAADKLDLAAEKFAAATANIPAVKVNTGNTPTVPSVK